MTILPTGKALQVVVEKGMVLTNHPFHPRGDGLIDVNNQVVVSYGKKNGMDMIMWYYQ